MHNSLFRIGLGCRKALLVGAIGLLGHCSTQGQSWDLATDFSLDENPHGPWSFGWQDNLGGPLIPYDLLWGTQKEFPIKGFFTPGWFGPARAWCQRRADARQMAAALPPPGTLPYPDHWVEANFQGEEIVLQAAGLPSYPDPFGFVSKNLSTGAFGSWGYLWEPGMVLLMPPGQRGNAAKTIVRWTSPLTGRVIVKARFSGQRIQGDAGMRADVHVRHNSVTRFEGMIDGFIGRAAIDHDDALGRSPEQVWAEVVAVTVGDTLDFAVGTGSNFNYNVFGIQNKQLLPGVGLVANITVLPDAKKKAREWIRAKFEGHPETALMGSGAANYGSTTTEPPFSFTYAGKSSVEWLRHWSGERRSRELDPARREHTLQYADPNTGLVVRCVGVEYRDFPTLEWIVYFKNIGLSDTPIIENIRALDLPIERGPGAEFILHRLIDNRRVATQLGPQARRQMTDPFPYFNLELPGEGLIVALSWSGQAAIEFARDAAHGLRVRGGQELTHFKLHPGEEVRTPMIVLQFWSGDCISSQNVWRRWMIAHNMPKPAGKPLGPQRSASSAYQFGNMVFATEVNQKQFIDRYVEEGLKPDFWWMDAGWYPPNITSNRTPGWAYTGTWEPDKTRFPNGLRAISDHAHQQGIKTIVWFQPERVSPTTWLYVNHPEWLLGHAGADKLFDFGNPAAWQWAAQHFSQVVRNEGVDIYRQDMNIGPVGFWRARDSADRQGITEINHVMGYLAYLDELLRRNPHLRLDHFRIDLETLRRAAPLILGIDFEPVGDQCHNYRIAPWIPWHGLCARVIEPYGFRSMMCPAIVTGWDLRRKDLDFALARRLVHQWEEVAPNYLGDFYPLTPYSFENHVWMAWQFDRPETGQGVLHAFRRTDSRHVSASFKLRGLDPQAAYTVRDLDGGLTRTVSGRDLMEQGLEVRIAQSPGAALLAYQREEK